MSEPRPQTDEHAGHQAEDCEPSDCAGCRGWEDYVDEFGYG
jgi:hypothetical protein